LGSDAIADVFEFLTHLGLQVVRRPMGEHGPDGMYVRRDDLALVVVNSTKRIGRQRFTACHELAHHQFDARTRFDADVFGAATVPERRANAFAACLLMPRAGVDRWWPAADGSRRLPPSEERVVHLARHFGMSYEATIWRLVELQKIRRADATRLREVSPDRVAARLGYDVDAEQRERNRTVLPPEYVRLALEAYGAGRLSDERLGELLGVPTAAARLRAEGAGLVPPDETLDDLLGDAVRA
jgi:Zn-dependent peptidase ImmA (M78 family)